MFSLIACHLPVTFVGFKNFCTIKISVGSYGHSSDGNLPWAKSTLAASSVQTHSSYKKRNNGVFLPMSTMREAGELSSEFFKIFFLLSGKISSKSRKGKYHSVGGNGLKLQHYYN